MLRVWDRCCRRLSRLLTRRFTSQHFEMAMWMAAGMAAAAHTQCRDEVTTSAEQLVRSVKDE